MQVTVLNQEGKEVNKINLNEAVFGIEPHMESIYEVIKAQRAAMRQGTHSVKTRGEVSGGGRKPWRQKGTGRARQGTIRAGHWRGGGVIFGPTPRSYKVKTNRKVAKLAFRSSLSQLVLNKQLVVIDKIELSAPKTKEFFTILNNLKVEGKVLVVGMELTDNLILGSRNIPGVSINVANHVSVYDVLNTNYLVLTEDAVKYFEEALV